MIDLLIENRYLIESELGRGGMATVYRAQDTLLERPVAIKFISDSGLGTEGPARMLQEARAAARLNHPNIVAIYDVGQTGSASETEANSFIVMELVEGQTLRDFLSRDLDQTLEMAIAICHALAAAHGEGIIHRDLKPENVMVTSGDAVKLMDFGLARISGKSRLTERGTFMGTLSYLAPEIILGQEASHSSDLYALGVMLYEMSTGRPPFEADNLTAVISQHLHAPVVPPTNHNEGIPGALNKLIVSLLGKEPAERPESAEAVLSVLTDISHGADGAELPLSGGRLDRLVRGRIVGREKEMAEAISLWERSSAGEGQLLLISGEPGIGKSRLVKEISAHAEITGGKSLLGLCYAEERRPFGSISQMVSASMENGYQLELPRSVVADLLTLAPGLRLQYPDTPPNERLTAEEEQERLFESLLAWFNALTAEGQLLLVVDDIHWADSGSLAFLRYLARRLRGRRAMVVATYREVELDTSLPFQELLRNLNREQLARRIKLARLDKEATRSLLAALFAEEITEAFLNGIYRETEGNPFFIEEVCKTLVDGGALRFEDGHWQSSVAIEELEIPQGIRVAIQARLDKLSPEDLQALQLAALLGREFEYELLVAVSSLGEDALIDALETAEEAQLIEEVRRAIPGGATTFTFTHALIHSTLLEILSTLRRGRLQKQVALVLEETFPERREALAPLLGRYFAEAGDSDKAVEYLLTAADKARETFANNEAIEAYNQALLFLKESGDHERTARTFMKLGLTYHNNFAFGASQQAYEQGFTEWRRAADFDDSAGASLPPAPHPFRAAVGMLPDVLDPTGTTISYNIWIIGQIFSGLLQLTTDEELVPDIAHSWEVLDGGRTYVFHLRDDVRWSDGQPLTAADFEFAWKRALHPDNDQGLDEIFYDIVGAQAYKTGHLEDPDQIGIQVVDEHTLAVNLEGPTSYFLQIMASPLAVPVPRHFVEQHGSAWCEPEKIVTNGPFVIQSWNADHSLILERYGDYHGRFRGNLDQVKLEIIHGETGLEMYEADELDILSPYDHGSFKEGRRIIQNHLDDYITVPEAGTEYLVLDLTRPPLDDVRVRQALSLAIDREMLANRVLGGNSFPATGGLVPPGIPGHFPGIALPYDPPLAREKLAEAGYADGAGFPSILCLHHTFGIRPLEARHLSTQWKTNLRLEVTFEAVHWYDYWERMEIVQPNLTIIGSSASYADPDSFLRHASWLPTSGWRNDRYESLVESARRIADQEQRLAMYRETQKILAQEAPILPLLYFRGHVLIKPWLRGLPASMVNGNILKDIVIEPH